MSEQSKTDDTRLGCPLTHLIRLNVNSSFVLTHNKKKRTVATDMDEEKKAEYTEDERDEIAVCVVSIFLRCLKMFGPIRKNHGIGTECGDFKVMIEHFGVGKYRFIWHTKPRQPVEDCDPE